MGNILTIILALLIFSYTFYQINRIYKTTKKGKCVDCAHADQCSSNPENTNKIEFDLNNYDCN